MAAGQGPLHDLRKRFAKPYGISTMLPLIELKMTALSAPFHSPFTGEWSCNGHDVALKMDRLRAESESLGLNMDQSLSHHLVRGFSLNYVKRPILIWFGLRFDCCILSFSDKLDRYYPNWAHEIPGYFEEGREAIRGNSLPYAYWNGQNLHRLYPAQSFVPSPDEDGNRVPAREDMEFVCDFGSLIGWMVSDADPDTAARIRFGGDESWEYSVVPHVPEEIIRVGDLRCVLLHSRFTMTA
jgi:hypothetical protein